MNSEPFTQTIKRVHVYYEVFMAVIAYTLNFLVLWLALTKSTRTMTSYRMIILLSCGVDLIFITVNLISMSFTEERGGRLFMFVGSGLDKFDHPIPLIMNMIWLWGLNLTVVNIPMMFLHRWSLFYRQTRLPLIKFFGIYGLFVLWITFHSLTILTCFDYGEKSKPFAPLLHSNPIFMDTQFFIVANGKSLLGYLHLMDVQLIVIVSYGIVIYTSRAVFRKLRDTRDHLSASTLAAQKQLTVIMLFQACVPFFVLCVPILGAVICTFLILDNPLRGYFFSSLLAFIPIFNSVCVIAAVPSFRRALCGRSKNAVIELNRAVGTASAQNTNQ